MSLVRRVRQRSAGSVLTAAAVMLLLAGVMAASSPSFGQEPPPGRTAGGWCPAGTESLDVLILMDESRSLRRTDPDRERIKAVKNLIGSLEEESDEGVLVRVAMAAFGTDFELRKDFTDLSAEGADGLLAEVDRLAEDDWNTDYVYALYGVLGLDWSAECQRVVWYTDGEHDLDDAPSGGAASMAPRDYDRLGREIVNRGIGREVGELLIPAVCGAEGSDEVAPGYGDLSDRLKDLAVGVEFNLYHSGALEGDSKTLIDKIESKECGDGIDLTANEIDPDEEIILIPTTTTTTTTTTLPPPPPVCQGLEGLPRLASGTEIVWSGVLPEGIAPAFVRSVIIKATGDPPELSTGLSSRVFEDDQGARRLTLDFAGEPLSSFSPAELEVRGEGVDESCAVAVLEPPSFEARVVTSPIFPDTPDIELAVRIDGRIPSPADEGFLTVSVDGEAVESEAAGGGSFRLPGWYEAGSHTFEVRMRSDYSDPVIASGSFIASPKPDGPILRLAEPGPDPVASTRFTIPIIIDDDGRPGAIRLLPAEPVRDADGGSVGVEIRFPDGSSEWSSGDPAPGAVLVVLDDSVQTPENHTLGFGYESDPSDPAGETRRVAVAVRVDIDHPRNPALERIIVAAFLLVLLAVFWGCLLAVNRIAGRIRCPKGVRYSRFRVTEEWTLDAEITREDHRPVKHKPALLEAGRLRARRKTPLLAWRFPYVELSMEGSRGFRVVGDGFGVTEKPVRSVKLGSESRLRSPIVLVDMSIGPPYEGVVMSSIDRARPAEEQLTARVRRALEMSRPDQTTPDRK